jgi:hypothetical protein
MPEKAVSAVSLKALQPIAKATYTADDAEAKALTRKIIWKLDTRYFCKSRIQPITSY